MKPQKITAVIALIFSLCLVVNGTQPPGPGPRPGVPPSDIERFSRALELTEAQKTQIKTLHEQARQTSIPYLDQLKPLHDQEQKIITATFFDESALRELSAKMVPLQIELNIIRARTESAIFKLLTAEQKIKLAEIRKELEGRFLPEGPQGESRGLGGDSRYGRP